MFKKCINFLQTVLAGDALLVVAIPTTSAGRTVRSAKLPTFINIHFYFATLPLGLDAQISFRVIKVR